ncbi:ABC-type tripartite efflux pump ATP binding/membrane subunit [Gammaproteobacteria bacterium]
MRKPLLELTHLSRYFIADGQKTVVLKNINLTIYAGEMIAIVGASGSGKSTLMNILGCLDQPSEGIYKVAGQRVDTLDSDALAKLRREYFGFIFQHYHLLPHLNATQNTEMPAVYSGIDKAQRHTRAQELLKRLGLSDRYEYRPSQLSGGQQQRVSIARALMNGGDVILADEPTGALDSKSGQEIMNILHELHERGHTIILVTHNTGIANYAERIIEISDGEIINDRSNLEVTKKASVLPNKHLINKSASVFQAGWWRLAEAFKMALISITAHKIRTLLTMLGIIIGITAVVSVVAIGQGTRQKIIAEINSMGTNVINIYSGADWGDDQAQSVHALVQSDLEVLKSQVYIDSITPEAYSSSLLRYSNIKVSASITGVSEQYFRVRGITIAQGIAFRTSDIQRLAQVVIIDHNTSKKLFPSHESPIGKIIFIGNLPAQIIGVTKEKENSFGMFGRNLNIWLPYTTVMGKLLGQQHFNSIAARIKDGLSNQIAEDSITKLLKARHGNRKDFFIQSIDNILRAVKKTTANMTLMISAIALISLLVGGIGVMNIMLVSVSERTHEIGIRMAVGARQSDIMQQFLIEAIIVCLVGGTIGIALSYAIGLIFSLFVTSIIMKFSIMSCMIAFFCSSLIGMIFGFLPARNAAKLDPIVALARD